MCLENRPSGIRSLFTRGRGDRDFSSSFGSGPSCDMKRPSMPQGCGTDEGQVLTVRMGDQPLGWFGADDFCERTWNW